MSQETDFESWKNINDLVIAGINTNGTISEEDLQTLYLTASSRESWPCLNSDLTAICKNAFATHFSDMNNNSSFYLDLEDTWDNFADKVRSVNLNGNQQIIIPEDNLALKFIHRYNSNSNRWYVTVQLCEIGNVPIPTERPEPFTLYTLTDHNIFFDITENGVGNYTPGNLGLCNAHQYCTNYFSNVNCDESAVVPGDHVQGAAVVWNALLRLRECNGVENAPSRTDDENFSIVFASGSSHTIATDHSNIEYPHSIIFYLKYDGEPCLDNNGYVIGNYFNKAADFNTLCPLRCGTIAFAVGHYLGR